MKLRPLLGLSCLTLGVAVSAGAGVTYASIGEPHSASVQKPIIPNWAGINKQNNHLLRTPRPGHGAVVGLPAVRIRIPAINLNSPVIPTRLIGGSTWQVAGWAVGFMVGSPRPGQCTRWAGIHDCVTALSAHDDIKGEIFRRNGQLKYGNKIFVYTRKSLFTYKVTARYVVSQNDSSYLFSPVKSVALVSCTPYWQDYHRLIVIATLKSEHTLTRRA